MLELIQPGGFTGDKGLGSDIVPVHSWHSESAWSILCFAPLQHNCEAIHHAETWLPGESPQLR